MAATIVRLLGQVAHDPTMTVEAVAHALNYSPIGDIFEFEDWALLSDACKEGQAGIGKVKDIAFSLLPKYYQIYTFLDHPRTTEDWKAKVDDQANWPRELCTKYLELCNLPPVVHDAKVETQTN
jgi:hypothetical protein